MNHQYVCRVGKYGKCPLFILGIGYWMQWNYHTNATYVRYFTDDLIAQKPTYIDTIRNIHNHLKRRAWQGTIENVYAKKTHDTWLNLRIRRIRLTCTRHQNAVSVACNHCERMLPRSHEIAVLLVSRHMVRVPGESIWRLPDSIDARAGRTWENNCSWNETLRWKSSEITWRCTLFIEDL